MLILSEQNGKFLIDYFLIKRIFYVLLLLILVALLVGSSAYCICTYDQLKNWYFSLNDCLYNRNTFTTNFFTPDVKYKANKLCLWAIIVALSGIVYIFYRWRKQKKYAPLPLFIDTKGWMWYATLAAITIGYSIHGWYIMPPSHDEIFSAVNCTELHPFQTISYYMLPNNHMYFNLANNLLFHFATDHIYTGRILSMIAYVVVSLCIFQWLHSMTGSYFLSFVSMLPIIFQFSTWGFSFQARGYEVQLLCGWMAFLTTWRFIYSGKMRWVKWNGLFLIAGFALVPFFIYYIITQCLFVACFQVYYRHIKPQYWKYMFFAAVGIFILYLPAFCFSGIKAFTENRYVSPATMVWTDFSPQFFTQSMYFINYCFSMLFGEDRFPNFILFFMPLFLFFSHRSERRIIAFFYLLLWGVYLVYTLYMRRVPFCRNLTVHYSFSMAFVVYTFLAMLKGIVAYLKQMKFAFYITCVFFCAPVIAYSIHLLIFNERNVNLNLYFNDVNSFSKRHRQEILELPRNSSIGYSEECFYLFYLSREQRYKCTKCPGYAEDYYVNWVDEPLPQPVKDKYELYKHWSDNYNVYKLK